MTILIKCTYILDGFSKQQIRYTYINKYNNYNKEVLSFKKIYHLTVELKTKNARENFKKINL